MFLKSLFIAVEKNLITQSRRVDTHYSCPVAQIKTALTWTEKPVAAVDEDINNRPSAPQAPTRDTRPLC